MLEVEMEMGVVEDGKWKMEYGIRNMFTRVELAALPIAYRTMHLQPATYLGTRLTGVAL